MHLWKITNVPLLNIKKQHNKHIKFIAYYVFVFYAYSY